MKIKNYLIILSMSLLMLSMNQVSALEKMSKNDQAHAPSQVGKNEEFPPYSTEQYVYAISSVDQPAESDLIVEPIVVSDVIKNNYWIKGKTRTLITQATNNGKIITTTETWKTKYFTWRNGGALLLGTIGVVALTYIVMKQLLHERVKPAHERAKQDYEQAFKDILGADDFSTYKKWLLANDESELSFESYKKHYKWLIAAHESGHALESFLNRPEGWMIGATMKADENYAGGVFSIKHYIHDLFPASLKNDIKVSFAGGIGMSVINGDKLNFEDFLHKESYCMGDRKKVGTDLSKAYKQAEEHFGRMNSIDSWIPKDYTEEEREQIIVDLLKECYEETYQDISSHKDELLKMTKALYEKETIDSNEIYTIASGKMQEFSGLMSSNEQWKKYLTDIASHEARVLMNLYEHSPYEMHDVLG